MMMMGVGLEMCDESSGGKVQLSLTATAHNSRPSPGLLVAVAAGARATQSIGPGLCQCQSPLSQHFSHTREPCGGGEGPRSCVSPILICPPL